MKFILDGKEVEALEGETIWQVAKRLGTDIPHLCYSPEPGYRADGNCRACMVEIEGERVLAASCIRKPDRRHEGEGDVRPRQDRAADGVRTADFRPARPQDRRARSAVEILGLGRPHEHRHQPLSRARQGLARPQPSRHGGQSRRLHPVQSLRSCLPRSAGQRRHRHGRPRPRREDRVRLRRSDGQPRLASPAANACRLARPAR